MLIILIQWILILYTVVGVGACMMLVFQKTTKTKEQYSTINYFLIGLGTLVGILSILRIFIPINFYFYLVLLVCVSIFYLTQKSFAKSIMIDIKTFVKKVPIFTLCLLLLFILFFAYNNAVGFLSVDGACYHLQASKWIETYPLTPGIANVEERLGFNSSFHLLSAPFTLSLLLGDPIYLLHSLFFILLLSWSLYQLHTIFSAFYIIFFSIVLVVYYAFFVSFFDSNTDILPNIVLLYTTVFLLSKIKDISTLKNQSLLIASVAILMCTLKLSLSPFSLFLIYIFYLVLKGKNYRKLFFIIVFSLVAIVAWLYSNIIISGYLLYPFTALDIFHVDWKLPVEIANTEQNYIKGGAIWQLNYMLRKAKLLLSTFDRDALLYSIAIGCGLLTIILSPIVFFQKLRNKISTSFLVLFIILLGNLIFNFKMAPDYRFSFGLLYSCFLMGIAAFPYSLKHYNNTIINRTLIPIVFLLTNIPSFLNSTLVRFDKWSFYPILKPLTRMEMVDDQEKFIFRKTKVGNVEFTITEHPVGFTMYNAPCAPDDAQIYLKWRFNDFSKLENRGEHVTDGFRTKTQQ